MLRYHFIESFYRNRHKNHHLLEISELRQMHSIVQNNRDTGCALKLIDRPEEEILDRALKMMNRYKELSREEEKRLLLMLRLLRAMHYSWWFTSWGIDECLASLYQLPHLYGDEIHSRLRIQPKRLRWRAHH